MKRIILLAGFLILIIGSKSVITGIGTKKNNKDLEFYVATNGNDSNPGILKKPFATLTKARDEVRRMKNSGQKGNIIVWIRGGVCNLTETVVFGLDDSGSKNQLITYSAYPGEEPVFSSGKKIQGWKKMSVPPEGLPEISASHIWVASVPEAKAGTWRFRTLYDGMVRLPRARSAGFKPIQDERSYVTDNDWADTFAPEERKSVLLFPEGAMRNWPNLEDVELFIWPSPWNMNILGISSVDLIKGEARTTIPATYAMNPIGLRVPMDIKEEGLLQEESAWIENVPDALDEPGDWFLDSQKGIVVLWPKGDAPGNGIVAPLLKELIRVEGRVKESEMNDEPVEYLVFRGLTFIHGERDVWTRQDASLQHDWEMVDKATALLRFRSSANCLVDECHFTSSGGTGVRFDMSSQYNTVQNCLFNYLGEVGILICGYGPGTKDVSYRNKIYNNHLHDIGEIYDSSHGIIVWQSRENILSNNYIHDTPREGIMCSGARTALFDPMVKDLREIAKSMRWNELSYLDEISRANSEGRYGAANGHDITNAFRHSQGNVIEYNEIARVLKKGEDCAGINLTGIPEGNMIRNNWIHDIRNPRADAGIRIDGDGEGQYITGNIISDCDVPAINPADKRAIVENNIMIDCNMKRIIPRQKGIFMFAKSSGGRFLRNILYFSGSDSSYLLRLRYQSELKQYTSDFNLFYSKGNPAAGQRFLLQLQRDSIEFHGMSADPLFVDFKNKDFRLRPDSPMFKAGFSQIEMDKIGLTSDFPNRYR